MGHIAVEVVATVAAADLVSGTVHWIEDAYARPGVPLLGRLAEDNLRHHARPRDFLAKSWWESSWDLMLVSAAVIAGAAALGWLTWHVVLFAVLVTNANQIHKWAHMSRSELPRAVHWLQRACVLQSARHHGRHHAGRRDSHYCVITNFVNPLLEEVGLWARLERTVERLTGVRRRDEAAEAARLGLTHRAQRPACATCGLHAAT
jgi:ubiquitin-conjugating enzyme E2 variant